jgi:predicted dehydrogenase
MASLPDQEGGSVTERKARIALAGTGWWGTYSHLPALAGRKDVQIVALANRGADKLQKAALAFHVTKTYTDYREMLERETLDGVVIPASHEVHYPIAKAALERGCHVLIEKPMVLDPSEGRELLALAQRQNRAIVMSYPWGYTAHVRRARQVILSGALGTVQLVTSLFTSFAYPSYRGAGEAFEQVFGDGGPYAGMLIRPRADGNVDPQRGGGQGYCQVTHSAGLVFWVTGLRAQQVSAYMDNLDVAVDVVDTANIRLTNGAIGVLSSTGNLRAGDPGQHTLWVYGSQGYLILDVIAGTLSIYKNDGTVESPSPLPPEERYPRFAPANNFVDVILHGAENLAPGEIGQAAAEFLDAAYRSAAAGGNPISVDTGKAS